MTWEWELEGDGTGTFWRAESDLFYVFDDSICDPKHFCHDIIRISEKQDPVSTTIYRLTYGSLP
jgi:hypothetical protein